MRPKHKVNYTRPAYYHNGNTERAAWTLGEIRRLNTYIATRRAETPETITGNFDAYTEIRNYEIGVWTQEIAVLRRTLIEVEDTTLTFGDLVEYFYWVGHPGLKFTGKQIAIDTSGSDTSWATIEIHCDLVHPLHPGQTLTAEVTQVSRGVFMAEY